MKISNKNQLIFGLGIYLSYIFPFSPEHLFPKKTKALFIIIFLIITLLFYMHNIHIKTVSK